MPFLDMIGPIIEGNQFNRRYQWFIEKFSGLAVGCAIAQKFVDWTVVDDHDRLPFFQGIGEVIDYYEEPQDDGQIRAYVQFLMTDYFLFDNREDPEFHSLVDIVGYDLFDTGVPLSSIQSSTSKETGLVVRKALFTPKGISAHILRDRLNSGMATCLEYSIIAGLAASLYPFYRTSGPFTDNPLIDLKVVGVEGSNVLLGNAQDPLHFGVVFLDSNGERWAMLAVTPAERESDIIEEFKEGMGLLRGGSKDSGLRDRVNAQAMGIKIIKKSDLRL